MSHELHKNSKFEASVIPTSLGSNYSLDPGAFNVQSWSGLEKNFGGLNVAWSSDLN